MEVMLDIEVMKEFLQYLKVLAEDKSSDDIKDYMMEFEKFHFASELGL